MVPGLEAKHGGPTIAGDDVGTRVEVEGLLMSSVIDMVTKLGTLFHPMMIGCLVKVL